MYRIGLPSTGIVYMDSKGHRYTLQQVEDIVIGYKPHVYPKHWTQKDIDRFYIKYVVPYTFSLDEVGFND